MDTGRLILGALGGIAGTFAMTAVMRRLHRSLPARSQYPLPPREIVDRTLSPAPDSARPRLTTISHFGYGAAAGALFGLIAPRGGVLSGCAYGVAVWAASYLGWIPAAGILRPATVHPADRNALMITAHLVWGAVTALTARELYLAEHSIFDSSEGAR
jgi:hypothetical protein